MSDRAYKTRLIVVLAVVLAFNYVDGTVLGLVLQDIKTELSLTDTQLGFLSGIAFSLFYAVMGVPIARWADRGNRVTVITVTTLLWSLAVVLCGLATSFVQLLLIRVGVAVGEAGCTPPAQSLISDNFTRAERPRALGRYMMGGSLSLVIGYFAGGWLNEFYGWRATFILLGLPGLVMAAIARAVLREPRQASTLPPAGEDLPSLRYVFSTLWHNTTFRHLLLCFAVVAFFSSGINQWQPAFFIRSYGLKTGELGTWFAAIFGFGGVIGVYLGGELASRFAVHNERLQLISMAAAYGAFGVLSTFIYLSPDKYISFGLVGLSCLCIAAASGPLFAAIQALVPERMRAVAIALVFLFSNLIGTGLGPLLVGTLSDALRPVLGYESLRYALLAMCPGYFWCAWHLWRASKTVTRDLQGVHGCEYDALERTVDSREKGWKEISAQARYTVK